MRFLNSRSIEASETAIGQSKLLSKMKKAEQQSSSKSFTLNFNQNHSSKSFSFDIYSNFELAKFTSFIWIFKLPLPL